MGDRRPNDTNDKPARGFGIEMIENPSTTVFPVGGGAPWAVEDNAHKGCTARLTLDDTQTYDVTVTRRAKVNGD